MMGRTDALTGYENIGEVFVVGVFVHPTLDLNLLSDAVNQYAPDFWFA